jgi:hypothetical protein
LLKNGPFTKYNFIFRVPKLGQRSAEVAVVHRPKDVFGAVEGVDLEA